MENVKCSACNKEIPVGGACGATGGDLAATIPDGCALRANGVSAAPAVEASPQAQTEAAANDAPKQAEMPKPRAELHVVLMENGSYQVSGPFDDPIMFYGLAGLAMEQRLFNAIAERNAYLKAQAQEREARAGSQKKPGLLQRFFGKGDRALGEKRLAEAKAAREESERLRKKREAEQQQGASGTGDKTTH